MDGRVVPRGGDRPAVDVLRNDGQGRVAVKWPATGGHFVKHDAQRVEVRLRAHRGPQCLLGAM